MRFAIGLVLLVVTLAPQVALGDTIGLIGFNSNASITTFLQSNGHTVSFIGGNISNANAGNLAGLNTVILLRPNDVNTANADLVNFVNGGGLLITEWQGAEWALDTASLLNADGGGNLFFGTNTPITITPAGLAAGLGNSVSNPYSAGGGSEYQWSLSNFGTGVDILATRPGNIPVIIGGAFGSGSVLVNSLDWADGFPQSADAQQVLLNMLQFNAAPVPEPASMLAWGLIAGVGAVGYRLRKRPAKVVA